jgi:type VI protein secretion system component VasK
MSKIYEYVRHPRAEELRESRPVKTGDFRATNHQNFIVRLNAKVGLKVTLVVGTMWAAYLFTVLALFALPSALHQGTYYIIVWLSSSFLQLVLLPIIIVGQNIQAAAADKRAEDTYKDAEAVLNEAESIQKHLEAQDESISSILTRLEHLVDEVQSMKKGS